MVRNALLAAAAGSLLLAGCGGGGTVPPRTVPPQAQVVPPAPVPPPSVPVAHGANSLLPASTAPRAIVAPRIRVGMLSDQTSVSFPRIDGGYFVIADQAAYTLKRGFTI